MKQTFIAALLTLAALQTFSQAKQFNYGSEKRRYLIYIPDSYHQKQTKNFPLVFNFHGGGMTMTEHMFYTGMNRSAVKNEFIVVYPQGIKQDWNVGFDMSYQFGSNDVGYVNALIEALVKQYRIDQSRVYATGLSRGGFFCQRLAAELPEKFAAIASVGGSLPDSVAYFHRKKIAIPMMVIHGTADEIVAYNGKDKAYSSANATYQYWKKHNGLETTKELIKNIDRKKSDSTSLHILQTTVISVGVQLVSINGGGHTWPGSDPFNIGFPLGKTSRETNINELMWKFFSGYKRNILK
jgi:polyhydroxybutyrate depolymerase